MPRHNMSWKLGPVMMSPALLLHTQDMDHWELELQTNLREDNATRSFTQS